ncbi:MAG: efflux RND transporter periplasmic adaptor subunit [Schleiferiaceae bacterium]|nr:efflux RND transporter periplasmic adaptor subunit [Schleiferiaceae bacterium]
MQKKKRLLFIGAAISIVLAALFFWPSNEIKEAEISSKVTRDTFIDLVVTTGELLAENSEDIMGPTGLQRYRLYNVKIQDLVPEGTLVNTGDFVASLDKSEVNGRINDLLLELDKSQSQYTQTRLDTALNLRENRDQIKNLEYNVELKEITLEQSAYEPPATIRQAENDLKKAKRDLQMAIENYSIKKKQAEAKMVEVGSDLQKKKNQLEQLQDLQKEFEIYAPKEGMVTYKREWNGNKRKTGSTISPWDPAVATLPDLSDMLSKTYVNEIDIRKVEAGQKVLVSLDAFPDVLLKGEVLDVANIGEKKKGSDAKIFEVMIKITESDTVYRPGMTTSNKIITNTLEDVLLLPIDALFYEDNIPFVYKKGSFGILKQEITIAASNDEWVVVQNGVAEGDVVLLTIPEKGKNQTLTRLND